MPKLHQRDIRKLDSSFSNASDPVVLCRRHAIVINIDPIRYVHRPAAPLFDAPGRCVILRDRMLLLLPDEEGAQGMLRTVKDTFAEMAVDMAFEFRALEALMESIVRLLDAECNTLRRRVTRTLDRLSRRAGQPQSTVFARRSSMQARTTWTTCACSRTW